MGFEQCFREIRIQLYLTKGSRLDPEISSFPAVDAVEHAAHLLDRIHLNTDYKFIAEELRSAFNSLKDAFSATDPWARHERLTAARKHIESGIVINLLVATDPKGRDPEMRDSTYEIGRFRFGNVARNLSKAITYASKSDSFRAFKFFEDTMDAIQKAHETLAPKRSL